MPIHGTAIRNVFETASLGAPERAVGFVMWRVVHRYMREVDRALAPLALTHLQFMTLAMTAWLGRTDARVTQSQVAAHGDMHPMQVSLMLKALEAKSLIVRTRSDADVRAKDLNLTAKGLSLLRKALPMVVSVHTEMFGELADVHGEFLSTLLRLDTNAKGDATAAL